MPRLTGFAPVPLPGPPPVPLLGHLPRVIQFFDDPIAALGRLRSLGDVVAVSRNSPALVCVFGAERNRDVLGSPATFPHDEEFIQGKPGTPLGRMSQVIVNLNGEAHRRHRKLMLPAFSRAALEGYGADIVRVSAEMVRRWPTDQVADLDVLTRDLALCVAVQTLFGLDVLSGATELGQIAAAFVEKVASPLAIALPYDLPGSPYREASRLGGKLLAQLDALIARKRAAQDPGRDAVAQLMRATDDDGSGFSDDELVSEVVTLYIAGHETMAKTMLWTLFLLERHPGILADVHAELDAVLGDRAVTPADLPRLSLLDRVIKESMRILPSVPISFLRAPPAGVELGGVRLPANSNVIVSPFATHHDPAIYPEPTRFLPSRWETIKPGLYEYLPFGAGPRVCVGAMFAQMALRLMIPTILQGRRWSVVRDHEVSRLTRANILGARRGLKVRLSAPHRDRLAPAPIRGDIREIVALPEV